MEKVTIFYSWQSDTLSKYNRYFIEECIKDAIKPLKKDGQILIEYDVDRDTKNVPGSPDIVDAILKKIENSTFFIADITFIDTSTDPNIEQRRTPNPNVLIELGYAAAKLGWDNIICLFNTEYGPLEKLPFDIRGRRVAKYSYSEKIEKKSEKMQLTTLFVEILKGIDINSIKLKKRILEEFKYEKKEAIEIAISRKDYWEYGLLSVFLNDVFKNVEMEFNDIEEDLHFLRAKKMNAAEFLSWAEDMMGYLSKIISLIGELLNIEINDALNEPGIPGDPFKLKDIRDKFKIAFKYFIDLEREIRSVKTTIRASEINRLMLGWTKSIVAQLNYLPIEFEKIYNGVYKEGGNVDLTIDLAMPSQMHECISLVKYYNQDISTLLEDEYE